jgi:putative ABC transport system substrate-binding protein
MNRKIFTAAAAILCVATISIVYLKKNNDLPLITIASYGPHASLEASLRGLKMELEDNGFIENKTIKYEIADVGFDPSLIPQMIARLCGLNPKIMVVKTTPVAQYANGKIDDIPLIYSDINDPIEACLIKDRDHSYGNITGSSDQENLGLLLEFAKTILPKAKAIGILYSTSESNDAALVRMMKEEVVKAGISLVAIPIDQARDIPIRMQNFFGKVDFIYVGTSGPIQPALPTIVSEAQKMNIPVFNAHEQAVYDGLALASFGVNYECVGRNAGKLAVKILNGAPIKDLPPLYLKIEDHKCFVNKKLAKKFGIEIPKNATVVE